MHILKSLQIQGIKVFYPQSLHREDVEKQIDIMKTGNDGTIHEFMLGSILLHCENKYDVEYAVNYRDRNSSSKAIDIIHIDSECKALIAQIKRELKLAQVSSIASFAVTALALPLTSLYAPRRLSLHFTVLNVLSFMSFQSSVRQRLLEYRLIELKHGTYLVRQRFQSAGRSIASIVATIIITSAVCLQFYSRLIRQQ
ncbi:hypothetical protein MIR68_006635 [Amoeboaphelidium protococcarum]|nr:hypothetical protein MIR68_006635 [Amoeboaphelidium protococcarum]